MDNKITKVVIAGGGTAGWMAAAAFGKLMGKRLDITLVESDDIGTVGVGEATIPTLQLFHRLLGIKEPELMAATNATFKLGIQFENWYQQGQNYLHSFGFLGQGCWACGFHHFWKKGQELALVSEIGDYCAEHLAARQGRFAVLPGQDANHAYHFDAALYARFLRQLAENHGVKRLEGKIAKVRQCPQSGNLQALQLESGEQVAGDFFLDCTGFRALLIEQTLHAGFDDWTHYLPCDSAIAVQTENIGAPLPYTRAIAHHSGWQWRIPLQSRTGNGLVFCSSYMTDDDAIKLLLENIKGAPINPPRVIKFRTGSRRAHWKKNCVALGLASGFLEPLESTSIHLIQRSIIRLLQMFPSQGLIEADMLEFNRQTMEEMTNIRDFLVLHYQATARTDSPFWRHCAAMDIPDSLARRISLFRESGAVYKYSQDLFGESSWVQVMMGQGIVPARYHPIVDMLDIKELGDMLDKLRAKARHEAGRFPPHQDFINHYCKAAP